MSAQSQYIVTPPDGVPGQIADLAPLVIQTGIVEPSAGIAPGLVLFHGTFEQAVRPPATTDAIAASATAILATGGASSGSNQTLSGASLNGAVGTGTLFPARNATLTLSDHADWDATTAVFTGTDEHGAPQTENFAIPNGGNVTLVGEKLFTSLTSVFIPAQSGTGGTFTVGIGSLVGLVTRHVAGISVFTPARVPGVYLQKETFPVMRQGHVFMKSETAGSRGDPVYARFIASGAQVLGEIRATPDANNCVRIPGMQFGRKSGAGITVIEVNLPA